MAIMGHQPPSHRRLTPLVSMAVSRFRFKERPPYQGLISPAQVEALRGELRPGDILRLRPGEITFPADLDQVGLYLHVPFCERLCRFCACNRTILRKSRDDAGGRVRAYLDA